MERKTLKTINENTAYDSESSSYNELDENNLFLNGINTDEDFPVMKSLVRYSEKNELKLDLNDSLLSKYNSLFFKPAKTEVEKKFNAVLDAIRPALTM